MGLDSTIEVSAHFVITLPKSTPSDYHAYQQRYFAVRVRTVDYFGLVYWSNNCIHNTICSLGANHGDNPKSNNSQLTMSINGLRLPTRAMLYYKIKYFNTGNTIQDSKRLMKNKVLTL